MLVNFKNQPQEIGKLLPLEYRLSCKDIEDGVEINFYTVMRCAGYLGRFSGDLLSNHD